MLTEVLLGARAARENAEQLDNMQPTETKPSIIVTNSPFYAPAGRMQGTPDTNMGADHVGRV